MIHEPITLKEHYFDLSTRLIEILEEQSLIQKEKLVIGIAGESGSGKTISAKCLQLALAKLDLESLILHQDNYYFLPPQQNHEKRKEDLGWVGIQEVNFDLWQSHIRQFKSHEKAIVVPVVDYKKSIFTETQFEISKKHILIVEGVYSFFLDKLDFSIFLEKTYKDSIEERTQRTREVYDPFIEKVLEIEHQIVFPLKEKADVIVSKDYLLKHKSDTKK